MQGGQSLGASLPLASVSAPHEDVCKPADDWTGLSQCTAGLVSNFGGLTSALAGLGDGQAARQLHIDVLYPVRGFKRCLNSDNGFGEGQLHAAHPAHASLPADTQTMLAEFLFPASWLADQRLLYRAAERVQRQNPLDMPSAQRSVLLHASNVNCQ